MSFKTGNNVKVKNSLITGVVKGAAVDADANFKFLVEYTDFDGVEQKRYFKLEQLEAA